LDRLAARRQAYGQHIDTQEVSMINANIEAIIMTLNTINWNYGRGDIRDVNFSTNSQKDVDERGKIITTMQGTVSRELGWSKTTEKRKFRIVNDKLTFLGRTRKIKI
jgi:hypothetical protein